MSMMSRLCGLLLLALSGFTSAGTLTYTTYYHNDHLGSPVAATSEQGGLLWRTQYRPYGERQGAANQDNQRAIGYTGHVQDADSGLVYMRARYYDPLVGRFMAVDPQAVSAGAPGSFNRYTYVQGNPYRLKDPNGKWAEDLLIGVPSLAFGAYSFHQNMSEGNWGGAALDAAGMTADAVAIALPGVPGGAGLAIKAGRGAEKVAKGIPEGLSGLADASNIRFTQSSISATFKDGRSLQETIDALRSGKVLPRDMPAIRVFEKDGSIYTLDNRRLFAAGQAGVPVNITPATAEEISSEAWKFTTPNNGCIVCVKGGAVE